MEIEQSGNLSPTVERTILHHQNDDSFFSSESVQKRINRRIWLDWLARKVFFLSMIFALLVLGVLIVQVVRDSIGWLDIQFLTSNLSRFAEKAGIKGAIRGSAMLMLVVIPTSVIIGVATAVYLEEFAHKGRLHAFIQTNIANLAGVPSVIFGLLGLTVFGRLFGLGSSILAGGLTLSLLVLPTIVVASQEAIRAVPGFLRDASYGLGATHWTTIWRIVLPTAMPGILTGTILAISRAIGETAPLVVLGIPTLIMKLPDSIMDDFTALPIQIYYWTLDAVLTKEYANLAAATIIILMALLFALNSIAIVIRNKYSHKY